jgi:hypothetical protein
MWWSTSRNGKFSEVKKRVATLEKQQLHQQEANAGNEQNIQDQLHKIYEKLDAHEKSVMEHIMTVERRWLKQHFELDNERALKQQLELDNERSKSASSGSCWTKWFGQNGC